MAALLMEPALALTQSDYTALEKQDSQICDFLTNKHYAAADQCIDATITMLLDQKILPLLDAHAFGYAQQGRFDEACLKAEAMISQAPNLALGYVRKGAIFSLYGRQARAIKVFSEGLEMCKHDEKQLAILLEVKAKVAELGQRKIDFLPIFPCEIIDAILLMLPQETRAECLKVSHQWRNVVLQCKDAWKHVTFSGHPTSNIIMNVTPSLQQHFKHLTIDTKDVRMRSACLKYLRSNNYRGIRSVELTENATQNLEPFLARLILALSNAKDTLTSIKINYGYNSVAATLSDLLMTCTNLTKVSFSAANPRSIALGDFSWVAAQDSLVDLDLNAIILTQENIQPILKCCQNLRRLVVDGCDHSVLSAINEHAKNLQILGYNTDKVVPLLSSVESCKAPGLRKIYTNDGGAAIPAGFVLPLLYSNMATLDTVFADIGPIPERELKHFDDAYSDFRFSNISSYTFWGAKGIQPILLRAISNNIVLDTLSIVHSCDIKTVALALKEMPPVRNLRISHVRSSRHAARLVQLFHKYAQHQTGPSLRSITLLQCGTINDEVLNALTNITTLEQVTLTNLFNITASGLEIFLKNSTSQLTHLTLSELLIANDAHIGILKKFNKLKYLELDLLPHLTNKAFNFTFDENCTLRTLKVKRIPSLSDTNIQASVNSGKCTVVTK